MTRKLKVFQAQFGFHDSVVAAGSQAEALRLWGIHQNLFAEGQAMLASDPAAVQAALAHPLTPLRRAVGTAEPFGLDPGLPSMPDAPPLRPKAICAKRKHQSPPPPVPDRTALDAAEAALRDLDGRHEAEQADLAQRRAALQTEEEEAKHRFAKARKAAEASRVTALKAYRQSGGRA